MSSIFKLRGLSGHIFSTQLMIVSDSLGFYFVKLWEEEHPNSTEKGPACKCIDKMIYIIMGVSGCGKSTLGKSLSEKLGWPLHEGDDFHPQENIEKMTRGEPLTDQDRLPWLLQLHEVIQRERCSGSDALVVCSALKRHYRQILLNGSRALTLSSGSDQEDLRPGFPDVVFLFLHGSYDLIHQRMVARRGHYMRADLLRSQFDALEPPLDEENVLPLDIRRSITDLVMEVEKHFISRMPLAVMS